MRALFVSYMEFNTHIRDKELEESKKNIEEIIKNTKKNHFNTIILQVRSFDDAIYKSDNFIVSDSILLRDGTTYDVLDYFLKECSKEKILLYAWINPFRISRGGEELEKGSYSYKMKDSRTVRKIGDSYYYNPADRLAVDHIVEGVLEVVKNYPVDGVLFDDYFYPSDDIDDYEYREYLKSNAYISLSDYHLMIINNFIQKVYKGIKEISSDIQFGVSPDGNILNNYQKNYADVRTWCSKKGYIDFIMPQLYYGFFNTTKPYKKTMEEWEEMVIESNIKLYYALAFYKNGRIDTYAKEGINEWIDSSDIIKRQVLLARNAKLYQGFSLFRYDHLFLESNYTANTLKEFENLQSIIQG